MYENDLDTGVDSQGAAETDENEEIDESTQSIPEDEAEDNEVDFADFFKDEADEGNAEEEGSGSPPNQEEAGEDQQKESQPAPAERTFTQDELNSIIQKRLQQERASIEKKNAEKAAADAALEKQTQQYIDDHPDMNLPPELVKTFLKAQQPQAQPKPEAVAETGESRLQAWKDSLVNDEPMIQADMRDPSLTVKDYAAKDPIFNAILVKGGALTNDGPLGAAKAHMLTKEMRAIMQKEIDAAKAKGGQEVVEKIKTSNARAATPVGGARATGKTKTYDQMIQDTPLEELDKMLEDGKRIYIGGRR